MKKAFILDIFMLRYNGSFFISLALLMIFLTFSFLIGTNTCSDYQRSALSEAGFLASDFPTVRLSATVALLLVAAAFYILPMIEKQYDGQKKASLIMLSASLPVRRKDLAVSRMTYTAVSSLMIVLLAVAAFSGGFIYEGGAQWEDATVIIKSWFVMMILAVNIASVSSTALYLARKEFVLPALVVLFIVYVIIMLITPELVYRFILMPFFWTIIAALILLFNIVIGSAGVSAFMKRDI